MLRYPRHLMILLVLIFLLIQPNQICLADESLSPVLNKGRKWRIGYYEGGAYINYPANLRTLVAGLAELGWMRPLNIPAMSDATDSKPVWDYLVKHVNSKYLEFVGDGYWSAQWVTDDRKVLKDQIIRRLNQTDSIDFMIAMGTWAGQDLSNYHHTTSTKYLIGNQG